MHTQLIMGVFFWSTLVFFACWLVVELAELIRKSRRDAAVRDRLGLEARPGESAWEERTRVDAAETRGESGPTHRS
jgi:hypothetical protein